MAKKKIIENGARIVLSALLVAVFGAVGILVAEVRPFDFGDRPPKPSRDGETDERSGAVPPVPLPPETELTGTTSTRRGKYRRYGSRLSREGLVKFYASEMPRRGWERDTAFDVAQAQRPVPQTVLAFKAGRARCIIGMEESGPMGTAVTVLTMRLPRPDGSKSRPLD